MSGARILVTGGAGFVGFHLVQRLLRDEPNRILIVDDLSRGSVDPELKSLLDDERVALQHADLTAPDAWGRLGDGYDEVFHLAALVGVRHVVERPQDVLRVNALATLHLLDWFVAGGGERLLFSSTSEAYAWTNHFHELPIPTPEDCPLSLTELDNPRTSYAASKIFGEVAVHQFCRSQGKHFVVVRYHNVYGPRMGADHVIPELYLRAAASAEPLVVYSPDHRRAFCYISDAVEATVSAIRSENASGLTINVGNDQEEIAIRALAQRILAVSGLQRELVFRPAEHDPVVRRCPDLTRARALLGYEPRVDLDSGLASTISWYEGRSRHDVPAEASVK
jgi:nucleoside-diphosphate-sugar epimerase